MSEKNAREIAREASASAKHQGIWWGGGGGVELRRLSKLKDAERETASKESANYEGGERKSISYKLTTEGRCTSVWTAC